MIEMGYGSVGKMDGSRLYKYCIAWTWFGSKSMDWGFEWLKSQTGNRG